MNISRLKKRCQLTVLLVVVLVLGHAGFSGAGTKLPELSLVDVVSGEVVNTKQYDGKVRLVVFFATWCMPCMMEVPALISLQDDYGPEDFTVIALSTDRSQRVVADFIKKYKVNYPVLQATRATSVLFGGVEGLPTSFLVDHNGNVLMRIPGLVPHSLLDREVKKLLPVKAENPIEK